MYKIPAMTEAEFQTYKKMIYDWSGINLGESKRQLVVTRLSKRLRDLDISGFSDYLKYVLSDESGQEKIRLLDAISTNKTDFFRESSHFDFLNQKIYPNLKKQQQIRIWCAAASSGEEPYTLAITLLEALGSQLGKDIKILGTDISTKVLDLAQKGIYSESTVAPISEELKAKYFRRFEKNQDYFYQVNNSIKNLIRFRRLNLVDTYPLKIEFDFIFCRNVMIYFDKNTQAAVVKKMIKHLKKNGYLFIGHSESLIGIEIPNLKYIQSSIYQKTGN